MPDETRATGWLRKQPRGALLALGAAAAVFVYVGWDGALWDARWQLGLHLLAIGAIGGLLALALRGEPMPRTRIDMAVLGLIAAFALATLLAVNLGMSLRAMAAISATALMLPVALVALRHRPTWTAIVICVPVTGLAAVSLGTIVARRLEWILVGAPGLPPIRMPGETTPFGSVAVPPFVLLGAWAVAGAIEDATGRRWMRMIILVLGVPLTILSGSRSAWLAMGVAGAVLVVPWLWERRGSTARRWRPSRRALIALAALALGIAGTVVLVAPRALSITSLVYRGDLWRDTINAWSHSPITGIGPGIMPYARQAAAPDYSFPVSQPHSHNLALGVLGDAGIIGLAAAAVLVVNLFAVAGPWRSRTATGRGAAAVLSGIAVSGLFEDITFLPGFNLIVIVLVAMALADAGAVTWRPIRRPNVPRTVAAVAAATVLLVAMVVADAGGIAYRAGSDAANDQRWPEAVAAYRRAVSIDAWHPMNPDALGVALAAAGDVSGAVQPMAAATALNPGNGRAWANLTVTCQALADAECQREAARRAVAASRLQDKAIINGAQSLDALGEQADADAAYRRSLLTHPLTSFAVDWPRQVAVGDGMIDETNGPAPELNALLGRVSTGEPIEPADYATDAVQALAFAIVGDEDASRAAIERAHGSAPDSLLTWEVDMVLARERGESSAYAENVYAVLSGSPVLPPDHPIEVPGLVFDIGSFRSLPRDGFVPQAEDLRVFPLYPWILGEVVPDSGG